MNLFGVSFLLTFIISFFIGIYVLVKDIKAPLNWIFFFLLMFIGEDALVEFHVLISRNENCAQQWINIINIWPIILAFLMHFTLAFFKEGKERLSLKILLICYAPAIIFIILQLLPGYIELVSTWTRFGWTYKVAKRDNFYSLIMNIWAALISTSLVIISLYYWRTNSDIIKKRQAALILQGNIVITISAIISNVVLARLGERIPNTTMLGFLIGALFLGVGAWKYKIFNITISGAVENIVDAMPEALFMLDNNGYVREHNPAALKLTGLTKENMNGKRFTSIFEQNCSEIVQTHLSDQIKNHNKSILTDVDLVSQNEELIPVSITFSSMLDSENVTQGVICIVRDLKELKQSESENKILQSQLYQSQKMESIGRLAGGIAHDFNNMLAAISGYAEMIHRKFADENPKLKKYIGIIESAAERSAELTSKLLTFARKGNVELTLINTHEAIVESLSILEHTMGKNIKLDVLLEAENCIVYADLTQLQNMLLNFCVNARDAMPNGGLLIVKTQNVNFQNYVDRITHIQMGDGEYINIKIKDTGVGIEEHTLGKIFEPFFTTKGQGKGTGLGLASAFGTIHSLGGSIDVESVIEKGTEFNIYLPTSAEKIEEIDETQKNDSENGEGRILIVDDEDIVRSVALDMCRVLGYTPISASDSSSALSYYKKNYRNIQFVLLDVMMPEMDGYQCYNEMKKINPEIKVIFASGYTKDGNIEPLLKDKNVGYLQKPYRGKDLSIAIKLLLS